MAYRRPDKPVPFGCVLALFSICLFVIGGVAGYVLIASMLKGVTPQWSYGKLAVVALGCLGASATGFYATWRLVKNQKPIDPYGPMMQ